MGRLIKINTNNALDNVKSLQAYLLRAICLSYAELVHTIKYNSKILDIDVRR